MRGHVLRLATPDGERYLGIDAGGRWVEPGRTDAAGGVDLTGWVAVPGLVDAHAHLGASSIEVLLDQTRRRDLEVARHVAEQLAAGVLLVGDKGTDNDETVGFTLALDPAERPEVELAGAMFASPGGYFPQIATEIDGSELGERVDTYGPEGVSWVKLVGDWPRRGVGAVPNFSEAELADAVDRAHHKGLRVAVHTCAPETPGMAVRAGIDSIEHGLFLTEDDVAMLGARGGAWVPTIGAMEDLADRLGAESSGGRLVGEGLANVRRLLLPALDAGVRVLAGTDLAVPHGAVVAEGRKLVEYGLPEQAAVDAMVSTGRLAFDRLGLTPGQPADLLLADHPGGLAELGRPRLVLRYGRVVVDAR